MHYLAYILIPEDIFEDGEDVVETYINQKMAPYDINLECSHIELTKEELENDFEEYKRKYGDQCKNNTIGEYAEDEGYTLDEKGNAISNRNENGCWDWFEIGGRWNGVLTGKHDPKMDVYRKVFEVKDNCIQVKDFINKFSNDDIKCDGVQFVNKEGEFLEELDKTIFLEYLEANKDDYLVNLDIHS